MKLFKYILAVIIETLLRVFPFPCKTGLVKIGNPNRDSPVFLTGNFHLTVERVKRALKGIDCYLLVANSKGINVWCASAGGLLTNHDVISVLNTSGIKNLVDHKRVILPQFAATGVDAAQLQKKTRWKVVWGPAYANDISAFLENNRQKTPQMRSARFPLTQRFEMAISWAFPISALTAAIMALFWPEAILPLILLIWALAFLIFLTFPFYERWLNVEGKRTGLVHFDFGRGGLQLILWGIILLGLFVYGILIGGLNWPFMVRWGLITLIVVFVLSLDLMGSTPTFKSGLHEDRLLKIVLDAEKCKGAGFCEQVCPRNCFEVDQSARTAAMPRAELCVQCGACIVQCPFDALYFRTPKGETIPPEIIRKYKLNFLGERSIKNDLF